MNATTKDHACQRRSKTAAWVKFAGAAAILLFATGCRTGFREYVNNGFKVGPNYHTAAAPVADIWIDDQATEITSKSEPFWDWWRVFNDSKLEELIQCAKAQNLTIREAGFRIEEARALRGIAVGNLLPQQQLATGAYRRQQISLASGIVAGGGGGLGGLPIPRWFDVWNTGGQLAWELDFWGRYRRAIEAADATLDSTIENYDSLFVVMLSDVAGTYVEIRTTEQRIRYAKGNLEAQRGTLQLTETKKEGGAASRLDIAQAITNVAQTESAIPALETQLRQAKNRLCVLMGVPPQRLDELLGDGKIPKAPAQVAIGVPAELLRRRPDVRRAERLAAAQSARIGIAETNLYPAFSINGNVFVQAQQFSDLFQPAAWGGSVGPSFNWQIFNYWRLQNNIDAEEARFMALVTNYQNTVLTANQEAEDAIVGFLLAQQQAIALQKGVAGATEARDLTSELYRGGRADFGRVFVAQVTLVQQQDLLAQAEGSIAANLVRIYRALGGGWELRLPENEGTVSLPPPEKPDEDTSAKADSDTDPPKPPPVP